MINPKWIVVGLAALALSAWWWAGAAHAQTPTPGLAPAATAAVVTTTAALTSSTPITAETWLTYTDGTGWFTVSYPPRWTVAQQADGSVAFDKGGKRPAQVTVMDRTGFGDEAIFNTMLKAAQNSAVEPGSKVEIVDSGAWTHLDKAKFVFARLTRTDGSTGEQIAVMASLNEQYLLLIITANARGVLSQQDLDDVARVAKSLVLTAPMTIAPGTGVTTTVTPTVGITNTTPAPAK
jgi:hypothetical protein